MKKILMAFAALCCIALVSSFTDGSQISNSLQSDQPEDYTDFHLIDPPVADVPVTAYNCASRAAYDMIICPGSGVPCQVNVTYIGLTVTIFDSKDKDRASVEFRAAMF